MSAQVIFISEADEYACAKVSGVGVYMWVPEHMQVCVCMRVHECPGEGESGLVQGRVCVRTHTQVTRTDLGM